MQLRRMEIYLDQNTYSILLTKSEHLVISCTFGSLGYLPPAPGPHIWPPVPSHRPP